MSAAYIIPVNPSCSCDLSVDEPCPVHSAPPEKPEKFDYLTKADIIAAVEALKKANETPPTITVPADVLEQIIAEEKASLAAIEQAGWVSYNVKMTTSTRPAPLTIAEVPPRQENLFTLPPPATPCGWSLEWRWRPGEIDWTTGKPKEDMTWSPMATYRDRTVALRRLRSARYSQRHRKLFRLRLTLFDYHGDIAYEGPPEPVAGIQSAEPPQSDFTSPAGKIYILPLKK